MQKNLIINLILILLIIVFAIQNVESITIKLYFWQVAVSKGFLVVLVLLVGALLGVLTTSAAYRKKQKNNEKEIKISEFTESKDEIKS